jgi:hypothetical protein
MFLWLIDAVNPLYPVKIANYLIAQLDFQAPYLKKAQIAPSNTACFVYRHF